MSFSFDKDSFVLSLSDEYMAGRRKRKYSDENILKAIIKLFKFLVLAFNYISDLLDGDDDDDDISQIWKNIWKYFAEGDTREAKNYFRNTLQTVPGRRDILRPRLTIDCTKIDDGEVLIQLTDIPTYQLLVNLGKGHAKNIIKYLIGNSMATRYKKKAEVLREELKKIGINITEEPIRRRPRYSDEEEPDFFLFPSGDDFFNDEPEEPEEPEEPARNEEVIKTIEEIQKRFHLSWNLVLQYFNIGLDICLRKIRGNGVINGEFVPEVDLKVEGNYPGTGDMIPLFIGFLYGLYLQIIQVFSEENIDHIVIEFGFTVGSEHNRERKNVVITIPKSSIYIGRKLREWSDFFDFWTGRTKRTKKGEVAKNAKQYRTIKDWNDSHRYLDEDGERYILRNISDYWLNEFRTALSENLVDHYNYRDVLVSDMRYFITCFAVKWTYHTVSRSIHHVSRRRHTRIGAEDELNPFWSGMLTDGKWKDIIGNMVFFKGESGCFEQALSCECIPFRKEPLFCRCVCKTGVWKDVFSDEICKICEGKPVIVIAITIPARKDRKKWLHSDQPERGVELIYFNEKFYTERSPKVIFINLPEWKSGAKRGHCAVWRGDICEIESKERFMKMWKFNEIIQRLCSCKISFCPICGDVIKNGKLIDCHYQEHIRQFCCAMCGLTYEDSKEYEEHLQYHCKMPRYGAKISLLDEVQGYKDKKDEEILIIYADLESAIGEEGEHRNILAGWCDNKRKIVKLHESLEEMLEEWVKLPEKKLQIYFHNGEGYDFHFMVTCLCALPERNVKNFEMTCDSSEKIRYFSVDYKKKHLEFRDTFAFVSTSLEKWINSTKGSGCSFECFRKNIDRDKQEELLKKNPFPYNAIKTGEELKLNFSTMFEWMESEKAEEYFCFKFSRKELQEIKERLKVVHSYFGWMTIGDYYRDYLRCDVAHLCDCMEFFVQNVEEEYQLNAHQYYGIPGLTWAAWLKQNKFPLDPLILPKQFDVVNSTIRGGQTGAMTRLYEEDKEPGSFVCDLDCNSLYPTVMLKFKYPCHDWEEVDCSMIDDLLAFIQEVHYKGKSGFIEVDMNVRDDEKFYSYVPVASKRTIMGEYNYQAMVEYASMYDINISSMRFTGLTQVVGEHLHYCCHTRLMEWYLKNDVVELSKIHYCFIGTDEPVFEEYVRHNLEMRQKFAADPIKKMLYKLLNNSLYGKTYEDVTNRTAYKLILSKNMEGRDDVHRIVQTYGEWTLYEAINDVCEINKPVYLGACITEFSKWWMYDFFYNFIRVSFPKTEVLYTDTDALTIKFDPEYCIRSLRDVAERLNTDEQQVIDTSNFTTLPTEERHLRHNNEPGLFKSETGEGRIMKMVALRAKTYIMVCDDGTIKMSVKGCPMEQKGRLTYEEFYKVLLGQAPPLEIEYTAIRTERHRVFNKELTRIVLSADDRKRFISDDKIHTFPLFSKKHLEAKGKITLPSDIEFP